MNGDLHSAWSRLVVGALVDAGVDLFVVSPGSRSTPLTLAIAASGARAEVVIDERAAAFFALGHARVTGKPAALVCTSGTAGAHYLPAVIEASESGVPLVVITADRPWELVGCAAPQTIDQVKLFGGFVRDFVDVGAPEPAPSAIRAVPRVAAKAVARALGPVPGPVHVNMRFRKPLEPTPSADEPWRGSVDAAARSTPRRAAIQATLDPADARRVAARIARAERGVVVAGPRGLAAGGDRDALLGLVAATGFPLIAEATSQLRFGVADERVASIGPVDLVLTALRRGRARPDFIVQLGAPPTSSAYAGLVEEGCPRVVVSQLGWPDPWGDAEEIVACDPAVFARAVAPLIGGAAASASTFGAHVAQLDAAARAAVHASFGSLAAGALGEAEIARAVREACPAGALLVVGNSTPARDVDLWCSPGGAALDVLHQRGVAGIDGLVAGAAGASAAARRPTALLLGDVAFAHDVAGLALAARATTPLVIVVVDNGGGRIFEALPVFGRVDADVFERFFATPPSLDIPRAAAAFGVAYARPSSPAELAKALAVAFASAHATVVHAVAPPGAAAVRTKELRAAFEASLV